MKSDTTPSPGMRRLQATPLLQSKTILTILKIISWVVFTGLGIQAGAFLTNAIFAIVRPQSLPYLWQEVDLRALSDFDLAHFFCLVFIMAIVAVLKAILFFAILYLLHDKTLKMTQPFTAKAKRFILNAAYITLLIGLFSAGAVRYVGWLEQQGVRLPDTEALRLAGADVWFLMCVTLFVIKQIFDNGAVLQTEQELTV